MGTFLRWTGQQGRLVVLSASLAVGAVLLLAAANGWTDVGFVFLGMVLWLAGFGGLCVSIRCPKCNERVVWQSLHNRDGNPALRGLLGWKACPLCGYAATERRR